MYVIDMVCYQTITNKHHLAGCRMIRSMLFVPADSERKLAHASTVQADAVVLDLEDSVLPDRKAMARSLMRAHLEGAANRSRYWVRVNDLASGHTISDLVAAVPARPAGIVLPKILGPEDVFVAEHYLDVLETEHGIEQGSTAIAVLVTETPSAVLRMGELVRHRHSRVKAVMWGAEDLSSVLGCADPRREDGAWRSVYEYARTRALLAAHAMGVQAIDTVYVDFRDPEGLERSSLESRRDGFTGRVAIHPGQVDVINTAYTPNDEEIHLARRIVQAFTNEAGAVAIDGKMYDIPHLKAARNLLGSVSNG